MSLEREIISEVFNTSDLPVTVDYVGQDHGEMPQDLLKDQTYSHIEDVENGLQFLAALLASRGDKHDYTKLERFNDFQYDLEHGFREPGNKGWWDYHLTERHHLAESQPEDVNLLDVLEYLVDCCVAGAAREGKGKIRPIHIDTDVLVKAFKNTQDLIVNNIHVNYGDEYEDSYEGSGDTYEDGQDGDFYDSYYPDDDPYRDEAGDVTTW